MHYCIKCGKELVDDARFCFHCGAEVPVSKVAESSEPINNDTPAPSPSGSETPTPEHHEEKKSPWRFVGYAFAALMAVVLIIAIIAGIGSTSNGTDKSLKTLTKQEVADAWKEFDENLEVKKVTFDSTNEDKMTEEEIRDYVAKIGNLQFTD